MTIMGLGPEHHRHEIGVANGTKFINSANTNGLRQSAKFKPDTSATSARMTAVWWGQRGKDQFMTTSNQHTPEDTGVSPDLLAQLMT